MDNIVAYLQAYDRSMERVKMGLFLFKNIPGVIPSVDEHLILLRLLTEARVARVRPEFMPDTLRRRRVQLKEVTLDKMRAGKTDSRTAWLVELKADI